MKGDTNQIIRIADIEFLVSDYRGGVYDIVSEEESPFKKQAREWYEARNRLANLTPEEKYNQFMSGAGLLPLSVIKDIDKELLKERVILFFEENPKRIVPSGSVFKDLYKDRQLDKYESSMMRMYGSLVESDWEAVKKNEEYELQVLGLKPEDIRPIEVVEKKEEILDGLPF